MSFRHSASHHRSLGSDRLPRHERLEDRRMLATFTASNLDDSGPGSLRDAIIQANSTVNQPDEIQFQAGLTGSIRIASQLPAITDDLTIVGPGAESLIIDAGNGLDGEFATRDGYRHFLIDDGDNTTARQVAISGLTFTGGDVAFGDGGAIFNREHLVLEQVTIDGNSADDGGAIYHDRGSLTIRTSKIASNTGIGNGGGIYSDLAPLVILHSTVTGNRALGQGHGGGGGIFLIGGYLSISLSTVSNNSTMGALASGGAICAISAEVSVTRSVLSGNITDGRDAHGGGIYALESVLTVNESTVSGNSTRRPGSQGGGLSSRFGTLNLKGSTISGNSTSEINSDGGGISMLLGALSIYLSTLSGNSTKGDYADGGGVFMHAAHLTITKSTVTGNGTSGLRAIGGGIFQAFRSSTSTEIQNSIIAGNLENANSLSHGIPSVPDIWLDHHGTTKMNYSIIGDADNLGQITGNIGNQTGAATAPLVPLLGPLADHGGPTPTMALLPGSPALDAGDPAILFDPDAFDQRGIGFSRVVDGGGGTRIDIGAYESQGQPSYPVADYNHDGIASLADYTVWRDNLGSTTALAADGNQDETINVADYVAWRENFGNTVVPTTPPTTPPALLVATDEAFACFCEPEGAASLRSAQQVVSADETFSPSKDYLLLLIQQRTVEAEQQLESFPPTHQGTKLANQPSIRDDLAVKLGIR